MYNCPSWTSKKLSNWAMAEGPGSEGPGAEGPGSEGPGVQELIYKSGHFLDEFCDVRH